MRPSNPDAALRLPHSASRIEARTVIGIWLKQYNHIRPHQALGMRPPIPETLYEIGP